VDQFVPEVAELLENFRFLPSWRIDDVMISFAARGSVGPHFDNYDVFLLQGHGKRNWKIGQMCSSDSPLLSTPTCASSPNSSRAPSGPWSRRHALPAAAWPTTAWPKTTA
jgi:ribosomal protein L16 Arg81 hydroxylase